MPNNNTIKYAERGTHGLVGRAGDLVRRLDALIARGRQPAACWMRKRDCLPPIGRWC